MTEHEVTKPAEAELHSNTERRVKMDQSALISAGNNKEKNEDRKEIKARVQELESTSRGKVQGSLFLKYFRSGANPAVLLLLFSFFLAAQILASSADYFVSFWYVNLTWLPKLLIYLCKQLSYPNGIFKGHTKRNYGNITEIKL